MTVEPSIDGTTVRGWGVDADPKNDPTYPMRHRSEAGSSERTWERPSQQPVGDLDILRSIERPNISAVFGTSSPPTGISGSIRHIAFRYNESSYLHWLLLVVADRINVVEGVTHDLSTGHLPNFFAETGSRAAWRYNRARSALSLIGKIALWSVAALLVLRRRRTGEHAASTPPAEPTIPSSSR